MTIYLSDRSGSIGGLVVLGGSKQPSPREDLELSLKKRSVPTRRLSQSHANVVPVEAMCSSMWTEGERKTVHKRRGK